MRNCLNVIASLSSEVETTGLELGQIKFEKCIYSVWILLPSRFLSKSVKFKTQSSTFAVVLHEYGRESWYIILSAERRLRVLENRALNIKFEPKN